MVICSDHNPMPNHIKRMLPAVKRIMWVGSFSLIALLLLTCTACMLVGNWQDFGFIFAFALVKVVYFVVYVAAFGFTIFGSAWLLRNLMCAFWDSLEAGQRNQPDCWTGRGLPDFLKSKDGR